MKFINLLRTIAFNTLRRNMSDGSDPLRKARQLESKIKDSIEHLGLELDEFNITLDEDQNDIINLSIRVKPEALMTQDEEDINSQFDNIIKGL